jgi:hypothetical protein
MTTCSYVETGGSEFSERRSTGTKRRSSSPTISPGIGAPSTRSRRTAATSTTASSEAPRVRVVAEVIWPESSATVDVAEWKRYEAGISAAMASVPVSFICTYDTQELPAGIVRDAQRTHPVLRTAAGARPSARYSEPAAFVRGLERDVPELVLGR